MTLLIAKKVQEAEVKWLGERWMRKENFLGEKGEFIFQLSPQGYSVLTSGASP